MSIIFLNRFFHPDHSATSRILSDIAFGLAEKGFDVRVITSRLRYEDSHIPLPSRETIRGVDIHRVWTSRFGRTHLVGRALDYFTFYLSAGWTLWRLARAGDVIVAKTDPPMLSIIAAPIARWRGAKLVNWLQDIFPEVAQAIGVGGGPLAHLAYQPLAWLRDRSLRAAKTNVVLGERMAAQLEQRGVGAGSVRIIANFADGALIQPRGSNNPLRKAWGLDGKFVVAYSGNFGRAHECQTLLAAMTSLALPQASQQSAREATPASSPPEISWLFIGGGSLLHELQREVARHGLSSARFEPYQPDDKLSESLGAGDVHIVSLRPDLEGLIVPSKFYGIAAAGRPTIFIGDPDGEIARLLARNDCGHTVRVGDSDALARTICDLATDGQKCRLMGERARRAFEAEFDKDISIARWEALLRELSS